MRAIWKGAVSFGLVSVPVKLYSATESHDAPLHQVHEKDGGRIRYQRTCEVCGETVAYADIDRAYVDDEQTVVLTKEDLAALPAETGAAINPKGAVKALSQKLTTTKGLTALYAVQILFYVPPATATDQQVRVLGFSDGLVAASEVP